MQISRSKWYIKIEGKKQGPYTFAALKEHPRISPFTLAKKKSTYQRDWKMMGQIPELAPLFQKTSRPDDRTKKKKGRPSYTDVLIQSSNLNIFIIGAILILVAILYIILFFPRAGR